MPRNHVSAPMRVIILLAIAMCGLIACSLMLLVTGFKIDHIADMYPSIVLQDVLAFIVPAVAAMAICFVRPFSVMGLTSAPSWSKDRRFPSTVRRRSVQEASPTFLPRSSPA